ncbi:outer membrane beta-barrel protein [Ascidiimonas sp. W6]|uniref:outer membrane beta-barrel protein n=1 Tax=Ascidiimonas meishanensis TaxID=3128903 RepID=UPI0030EC20A1
MKKLILVIAIFIGANIALNAQINFEKGYIINNTGQKIDCLIKNEAWGSNPTSFQYKLEPSDSPKTGIIADTKEFGVLGVFKYTRYLVDIDRSSENLKRMSQKEAPEFKEENLFLEVLLEGDATLYFYEDGNLKRYFYTLKNQITTPEQLIYKSYKIYATGSSNVQGVIIKNRKYREQLWNTLKCNNTSISKIKDMQYALKDMMNVFKAYNSCGNSEVINYQEQKGKGVFNLRVSAGISSSSLSVTSDDLVGTFDKDVDFDNAISIRGGFEVEYVFAFNKNKWAVFGEPNYNYYEEEGESTNQTASISYTSIEIPVGFRHYMYLNDYLKLFVNTSLNFDFVFGDSKISYSRTPEAEVESGISLGLGLGLSIGKQFVLETRYNTTNSMFESGSRQGNFDKTSFILRYKIF